MGHLLLLPRRFQPPRSPSHRSRAAAPRSARGPHRTAPYPSSAGSQCSRPAAWPGSRAGPRTGCTVSPGDACDAATAFRGRACRRPQQRSSDGPAVADAAPLADIPNLVTVQFLHGAAGDVVGGAGLPLVVGVEDDQGDVHEGACHQGYQRGDAVELHPVDKRRIRSRIAIASAPVSGSIEENPT